MPKNNKNLSFEVFIYLITKYIQSVIKNISMCTGINNINERMKKIEIIRPSALRKEAYPDPPSSLVIAEVSIINAPPNKAGKSLTDNTEFPNIVCISQATHPITGGTEL
jgi:hypothetical protein